MISGVAEAQALVKAIRPILAGHPAGVQGAALADLLAIWLAGHIGETPEASWKAREALIEMHMSAVRSLVELLDRQRAEKEPRR